MAAIRDLGLLAKSFCSSNLTSYRAFATTRHSVRTRPTKSGTPRQENAIGFRKPKGKRQIKPHEFGNTLRHGFGEFNGLTNVAKLENLKNKVKPNKNEFIDFRILQNVREFFIKEIETSSLLYLHKKRYLSLHQNQQLLKLEAPKPTEIQKLAFEELLKPRNDKNPFELRIFSIAGETGCGKTYSYLIPLVNSLKNDESNEKLSKYRNGFYINSVILLPTNELIDQTHEFLKNVQAGLNLNIAKLNYENKVEDLVDEKNQIDILITTPTKFNGMRSFFASDTSYKKAVGSIKYFVIDEADTLLDRSFLQQTMDLFKIISHLSPMLKDVIIISSTISKLFNFNLNKVFKNNQIVKIASKNLHKINKKLELRIIDCNMKPFNNSKINALKQCLYSIYCDNTEEVCQFKKIIVFANEKETVEKIENELRSDSIFKDYQIFKITGNDKIEDRISKITDFNSSKSSGEANTNIKTESSKPKALKIPNSNIVICSNSNQNVQDELNRKNLKILITTDIMSRGLNFQQTANAVLYDIPKTTSDLVNRVGRVGRMGLPGRVFILCAKNEMKGWVKGLPLVVRNGTPLA